MVSTERVVRRLASWKRLRQVSQRQYSTDKMRTCRFRRCGQERRPETANKDARELAMHPADKHASDLLNCLFALEPIMLGLFTLIRAMERDQNMSSMDIHCEAQGLTSNAGRNPANSASNSRSVEICHVKAQLSD